MGVLLSSQTGPERSVLPQLASGASSGFAITRPTAAMVIRSAAGSPRLPVEQEIVRFAMLSCMARVRRMMGESIDRAIAELRTGRRITGGDGRGHGEPDHVDELGHEERAAGD